MPLLSVFWHNGSKGRESDGVDRHNPLLKRKPDLHSEHEPSGLIRLQRGDILTQAAELVKR
jgi:hypothetical protein